jgi:hypothetical protein
MVFAFPVALPLIVPERVMFPGPEVMARGRQPQQNNGNAPDFDETPRPVEMAGDEPVPLVRAVPVSVQEERPFN